jgi:hypothetical protein
MAQVNFSQDVDLKLQSKIEAWIRLYKSRDGRDPTEDMVEAVRKHMSKFYVREQAPTENCLGIPVAAIVEDEDFHVNIMKGLMPTVDVCDLLDYTQDFLMSDMDLYHEYVEIEPVKSKTFMQDVFDQALIGQELVNSAKDFRLALLGHQIDQSVLKALRERVLKCASYISDKFVGFQHRNKRKMYVSFEFIFEYNRYRTQFNRIAQFTWLALKQNVMSRRQIVVGLIRSAIEANPGPADQNWSLQHWQKRKLRPRKPKTDKVEEVLVEEYLVNSSDEEMDYKTERLNQREGRQKGKYRRACLFYKQAYADCKDAESSGYTGDLCQDVDALHEHFKTTGYVPAPLHVLTAQCVRSSLLLYVEGFGLRHFSALLADNKKNIAQHGVPLNQAHTNIKSPQGGIAIRRLLMFYYPFFYQNPLAEYCKLKVQAHMHQPGEVDQSKISDVLSNLFGKAAKKVDEVKEDWFTKFFVDKAKSPEVTKTINEIGESIGSNAVKGAFGEIKNTFNQLFESISQNFTTIFKKTAEFVKANKYIIIGLVVFIMIGLMGWAVLYYIVPLITGKTSFQTASLVADAQLEEKELIFDAHGFGDFVDWIGNKAAKTFNIDPTTSFSKTSIVKDTISAGQVMGTFERLHKFTIWFKDFCKSLLDWLAMWWTGSPYFKTTQELMDFNKKFEDMIIMCHNMSVETIDAKRKYVQSYEGLLFTMKFLNEFKDRVYFDRARQVLTTGKSTYDVCKNALKYDITRQQPVGIWMPGKAGGGKTTLMHYLVQGLFSCLKEVEPEAFKDIGQENWSDALMWTRNSSDSFWSRYANQWCVFFDDMFKNTDVTIKAQESGEWIQAKNDNPFSPPMAALAEKASTLFDSKVMIGTTNLMSIDPGGKAGRKYTGASLNDIGLTDPAAFIRRMDFVIEILENDKDPFNMGKLDAVDTYTLKVVMKDLRDFTDMDPVILKGREGFKQLVLMVADRYSYYYQAMKKRSVPIDFGTMFSQGSKVNVSALAKSDESQSMVIQPDGTTTDPVCPCGHLRPLFEVIDKHVCKCLNCGKHFPILFDEVEAHMFDRIKYIAGATQRALDYTGRMMGAGFLSQVPTETQDIKITVPMLGFDEWIKENDIPPRPFVFRKVSAGGPTWTFVASRLMGVDHSDEFKKMKPGEKVSFLLSYYNKVMLPMRQYGMFCGPIIKTYSDTTTIMTTALSYADFFKLEMINENIEVESWPDFQPEMQYLLSNQFSGWTPCPTLHKEVMSKSNFVAKQLINRCFTGYVHAADEAKMSEPINLFSKGGLHFVTYSMLQLCDRGVQYDKLYHWPLYSLERGGNIFGNPYLPCSYVVGEGLGIATGGLAVFLSFSVALLLSLGPIVLIIVLVVKLMGSQGVVSKKKLDKYVDAHTSTDKQIERTKQLLMKRKLLGQAHQKDGIEVEAHGGDAEATSLEKRIAYNTYMMEIFGKTKNRCGWVLALQDRIFACPKHFFMEIDPVHLEFTASITKAKGDFNIFKANWKDVTYLEFEGRDLCMFWLPDVSPKKDLIQKHGRSKKDESLDGVRGISRVEVSVDEQDTDCLRTIVSQEMIMEIRNPLSYVSKLPKSFGEGKTVRHTDAYVVFNVPSQPGDCSFGCVAHNPAVKKKFIGIHSGGNKDTSVITPIYTEDLEQLRLKLKEKLDVHAHVGSNFVEAVFPPSYKLEEEEHFNTFNGMKCWGKLNHQWSWPSKTKLESTIIRDGIPGVLPPYPDNEAPAKLMKQGDNDPVDLSFRKMKGKISMYHNLMEDDRVWEGVFNDSLRGCKFKLLNLQEVILGKPEWRNFHAIDLSTSAGFPWVKDKTKKDLIIPDHFESNVLNNIPNWYHDDTLTGERPEVHFPCIKEKGLWVSPELQYMFYIRMWYARQNLVVPNYVLFCLKDERRERSRVDKFYTRGFKASSVDHLLFSRAVLGEFVHTLETNVIGDSALGVNPYSSDWGVFAHGLLRIGDNIVSQDVDGWDLNFPVNPFLSGLLKKFLNYFGWQKTSIVFFRVRVAFVSSLCPYVVIRDLVFVVLEMPSGTYITSVANTLANSAKHRSLWYTVSTEDFDKLNYLKVFGDDSNMSIHSSVLLFWNGIVFAMLAKKWYNHTQTAQDKGSEILRHQRLITVIFLSRYYVDHKGIYFCPLKKDTLYGSVQWMFKPTDKSKDQQFAVICHNALREWAYWGRESFEAHKSIINQFLRYKNPCFVYTETYDERLEQMIAAATS